MTLNRPDLLNACDSRMHQELREAFVALADDDTIKAIVLTGAGRSFCSGSDLNEVGQLSGPAVRRYVELDAAAKTAVARCPKPVIAAVAGAAVGGGFELALACDLRIVAEDAFFSFAEAELGTVPGSGGLERLPAVVGGGIARDWAFTGRRVTAEEAFRTGLATRVVPTREALAEATKLAQGLAERSSLALRLTKLVLLGELPKDGPLTAAVHGLMSAACHEEPGYSGDRAIHPEHSKAGE